jgi:hypothetical protein
MPALDVGGAPIDRATNYGDETTVICKTNPLNADGTIIQFEFWLTAANGGDCYAGLFYVVAGNSLKCRSAVNLGVCSAGYNVKVVSLVGLTGDYIGFYTANNCYLRTDTTGGDGNWADDGNKCVVDLQNTFDFWADHITSQYGSTPESGPSIAKVMGVAAGSISKVGSVPWASVAKINGVG